MNKLQRKRLDLAIGYFAKEYYNKTKKFPSQTQIYKFLAFVDFTSVKRRGRPVFGLHYIALQYGPVPQELYDEVKNIENFKAYPYYNVRAEHNKKVFAPTTHNIEIELDYFAESELKVINDILFMLIDETLNSKHYSEASHQATSMPRFIKAWQEAYKKGAGTTLDYHDEVSDGLTKEVLEGYLELQELTNK